MSDITTGVGDFGAIAARKGAATLLYVLGFEVKAREKMEQMIASRKFNELDPTPEERDPGRRPDTRRCQTR
ncbi:MAG TPA: hypothetical protein VHT21_20275 [Stellaceae bacterium]|nr:hypothetical protein [Stellaceae bacterium]